MPEPIDFRSPHFLRRHILDTMAFYDRTSRDPSGGFFHFFKDDGTVYDRETRHLVSSARFVFNNAAAFRRFGKPQWQDAARHGLRFLQQVHLDPVNGGYAWMLRWNGERRDVIDATHHCYGLAFVLLAHAHALLAGIDEARDGVAATFDLMEQRFWEPEHGLYADEASPDWVLTPYRGQNANMHACEAMLAAFDATGEVRYLDRAEELADAITRRQAGLAGGLVWEHYHADWSPDWDYNRNDKGNIFRPWGYQSGHLTEWAKLLLQLDRHRPAEWRLHRARELFATSANHAWDRSLGGFFYGFSYDALNHKWPVCDRDKYFWVQAESIAAAALLAVRTGEGGYWDWYDRIWEYAWLHFVDHRHGAWYRILTHDNKKYSDEKSPAGKTDYHTMGACHDVLEALAWPD
jgi:mannose/cellobiose epimerase-like protein (N-acyl-D-glucosamine 2-epimerase family)